MAGDNNHGLPMLGGGDDPSTYPDVGGFNMVTFVKSLDANGARKPESMRLKTGPHGEIMNEAVMGRGSFVTAEELVEMFRQVTREELKNFLQVIRGEVDKL